MSRWLITLVLLAGLAACSDSEPAKNAATASPSPLPNKTTVEDEAKRDREARSAAINAYIASKHPGWIFGGFEVLADGCGTGTPCDIHLTKGKQNKVVAIIVKTFERADGSTYTIAFDARELDLNSQKNERLKEETREQVLANLDYEACQEVIGENEDEILAAIQERYADFDPPDRP